MKKYSGNRSRDEIKKRVLAAGGTWDQSAYDRGSDFTRITYKGREILLGVFGRFIIKEGKKYITESSKDMDGTPWYDELLELLYIPEKTTTKKQRKN